MRAIDADALYEKTVKWEAQAEAQVEKLIRTPVDEMTSHEYSEWKRWTYIRNERTAFKHDIADAPTLDVVPTDFHDKCMKVEIEKRMALEKHGRWIKLDVAKYRCSECGKITYGDRDSDLNYCCNCGAKMDEVEE